MCPAADAAVDVRPAVPAGDLLAIMLWLPLLPLVLVTSLAGMGMAQFLPRAWGRMVMKAHGFSLALQGARSLDDLQQPAVYISNHQSKLDTPILMSIWPRRCVVSVAARSRD